MSKVFTAIGLMSGTSLDGVDAAVIRTDGENHIERTGQTAFRPYSDEERHLFRKTIDEVKVAFTQLDKSPNTGRSHLSAVPGNGEVTFLELIKQADQLVLTSHLEAINTLLNNYGLAPSDIDIVGLHGQTILHAPEYGYTIQLGDGAQLAGELGIVVISDFRSKDMRMGGQGAPLVPVYHQALAHSHDLEQPVAIVNVGGVANVTYIGSNGELIAFDTGPGNALINDWVASFKAAHFDVDGKIAAQGRVKESVLAKLLTDPYFSQEPPKSLDRNHFSLEPLEGMSLEWGAMTLTSFTALAVSSADFFFPAPPCKWIICGGGVHNSTLMKEFQKRLPGEVLTASELGWSSDFMEAEAFAYMAVRSQKGLPLTYPSTTGVREQQCGGVLHKPQG